MNTFMGLAEGETLATVPNSLRQYPLYHSLSLSLSFFFPFSRLYTIPGVRVSRGLSCRPCLSTLFDDIIPSRVITRKTTRVLLALNRVTGVFKFVMWVFRYRFLEGKIVEMKVRYVV